MYENNPYPRYRHANYTEPNLAKKIYECIKIESTRNRLNFPEALTSNHKMPKVLTVVWQLLLPCAAAPDKTSSVGGLPPCRTNIGSNYLTLIMHNLHFHTRRDRPSTGPKAIACTQSNNPQ